MTKKNRSISYLWKGVWGVSLALVFVIVLPRIGTGAEDSLPINNLSVPVVFAEGIGLGGNIVEPGDTGLRGDLGDIWGAPYYDASLDGFYMLQQDDAHQWQADWLKGTAGVPVAVNPVDWGDNLVRTSWTERSFIRVEVVLFHQLPEQLNGYAMQYLYGEHIDEVWGTPALPVGDGTYTGTVESTSVATVYSTCARIMIHKLSWTGDIDQSPTGLIPDTFDEFFMDHVAATYVDSAVHEKYGNDGRTGHFSAEVNVAGKIVYGYNWDLGKFNPGSPPRWPTPGLDWPADVSKVGWYRITFSLDPAWDTVARNATLEALDPIDLGVGGDMILFPPHLVVDSIDNTNNYTYIDIYVTERRGGGKRW
jgi:hypothetical protein